MIHNKVINEELHRMINRLTGMDWDDVSYGNDDCDSIENSEFDLMIFLPNFYDYTSFTMMRASEYGMGNGKEYYSLGELVKDVEQLKED